MLPHLYLAVLLLASSAWAADKVPLTFSIGDSVVKITADVRSYPNVQISPILTLSATWSEIIERDPDTNNTVSNCTMDLMTLSRFPNETLTGTSSCGSIDTQLSFGFDTDGNRVAVLGMASYPFSSFDNVLVVQLSIFGSFINTTLNLTEPEQVLDRSIQSALLFYGSDAWLNVTAQETELIVSQKTTWREPTGLQVQRVSDGEIRMQFTTRAFRDPISVPLVIGLYVVPLEPIPPYGNRRAAIAITSIVGSLFGIAIIFAALGIALHFYKQYAPESDSSGDL